MYTADEYVKKSQESYQMMAALDFVKSMRTYDEKRVLVDEYGFCALVLPDDTVWNKNKHIALADREGRPFREVMQPGDIVYRVVAPPFRLPNIYKEAR